MKLSDLVGEMSKPIHFADRLVSPQLILELLNVAVWAPNDGLREPWRFIFADNRTGQILHGLQEPAPAYLLVVMREEADRHKQEEDFAAVSCLIQNFRLLAHERNLGVRWTLHEWMYDRSHAESFGVQRNERIAAVLEMGYTASFSQEKTDVQEPQLRFELL
ncbi:hypothetical protein D3P07_18020 [Paenibacillus sp. 1011MAR3C5]|uniref:nitroreductase family protein n=1 Tax=Paenibacillus sp. 1011MAR3C5 TaxID=1675787 RepID=UPI000E6C2DB8|nr:nitroreductase family protein [Paenibacillus sp. 1011MAR3C5]RJE87065.1 hypothetical protein D3P07_18020 [Paenibacillus sp. 1011MAR3C5]